MVEAMTESRFDPEDEAFNEIERQSQQRKEAVLQALHSENERLGLYKDGYATRTDIIEEVLQLIKELRPAIKPLEGMGKGKTTQEWFDILVKDIEEKL